MTFIYRDKEYEVEIIRKDNKNTYVRFRDDKIYVTTNYFASDKYIDNLLKDNYKCICKMIRKAEKRSENYNLFLLFGKHYEIIYGDFENDISLDETSIKALNEKVLCKWLDKYIHTIFYSHLMYWYDNFEESIPLPTLKIRKMRTRWGVCNTKKHTITLNSELYKYDLECLDYVVIHELSHLIEGNHSRIFWSIVEKYCPNYKEIKKKLKE